MERIIDVYYGSDNLPYKDEARTIHFPVAGSEFLGASQTTTIRFHYEQIGTDENVYTVESKRPDGKTGSQLLSKNTTEHYAEMSLSGWYSECKGDLFLSLKVYRGGTTATYNETTQLWEVSGVPVIESTGAIKLAINYTPMGRYENYNDAVSTFQQVLAALGDKLDTIKGIVGVSGLSQVDTTEYEEGQLFFNIDDKALYQLVNGSIVPFLEAYSKSETNDLLDEKADKSTTYTKTEIDDLLTDKQDKLVSGETIKTINNISLLGSGNIVIQGGSGDAEWGSIGGDIADQTDLQNELQDIREVAEGKCDTIVLNYATSTPHRWSIYYDYDGNEIGRGDSQAVANYIANRINENQYFNNNGNSMQFPVGSMGAPILGYLVCNFRDRDTILLVPTDIKKFRVGDIFLVGETEVPDRWLNSPTSNIFYKLETSKVNLDNYSTKSETSTEVNKVAHDIATEYDENTLYGSGDLCIKDKLLYKCNTANTTGTWDSTKWDLTTVNSELGIIKGNYATKTEVKQVANQLTDEYDNTATYSVGDLVIYNNALYRCTTAVSTAEDFDPTKWQITTIKDAFANKTSAETISGIWTFGAQIKFGLNAYANIGSNNQLEFGFSGSKFQIYNNEIRVDSRFLRPQSNDSSDLGTNGVRWRDAFISRYLSDGTNSVTVADLANLIAYAKSQGWIS